jgi:hypothetical protein
VHIVDSNEKITVYEKDRPQARSYGKLTRTLGLAAQAMAGTSTKRAALTGGETYIFVFLFLWGMRAT